MADPTINKLKLQRKLNDILKEERQLREDNKELTEGQVIQMAKLKAGIAVEETKEMSELLKESAKHAGDLSKRASAHLDILKNNIEIQKKELELRILNEGLDAKQIAQEKAKIAAKEESLAATERVGAATKNLLETTLGISDSWKNTFVGSLMSAEGGLKQFGKKMADTLTPANMLGSTLMKVQEATALMVMTTDSTLSGFNKMTGAAGLMDEEIFEAYRSTDHLGVSMADTAGVTAALRQSMGSFKDMSKGTRQELIAAAAEMTALGISGDTAGRTLATLQTSLGMTTKEAIATQRSMAAAALEIGMAPAEMAEGFQRAMPILAAYGKQAPEIFKRVAAAAKGLNVSMDTLINMTQKMDTFEGAAEAAGRLNSVLGGPLLNSMDLLMATEDQRIRMILQATEASGRSWASMGKFEKKALAAAAGITDMNEASNLFSAGLAGLDKNLGKTTAEQKRLADAQKAGVSILEKLTIIGQQFAIIVMPIVDSFRSFLDGVLDLNESMGGKLIPTILKGLAAFWVLVKVMKVLAFIKTGLLFIFGLTALAKGADSAANVTLGTTSGAAAVGVGALGTAAGVAAVPLAAFGGAAIAAAGGVLGFAGSVFTLAGAVLALAGTVLGLAVAFILLSLPILALVAAFFYMLKLFMDAPEAAVEAAGAITLMGLALIVLATGLGLITLIAPFAFLALGVLATAFWLLEDNLTEIAPQLSDVANSFKVLADAMGNITTGKVSIFGQFFDKLADVLDEGLPDRIMMVAFAMQSLANSIERMPESKTIALTATLEAFEGAIEAAIKMKPEMKESLAGVVMSGENAALADKAIQAVKSGENAALANKAIQMETKVKSETTVLADLKDLLQGGGKDKSLERTLVLEVNGDRLATVVVDLLAEKYDLQLT